MSIFSGKVSADSRRRLREKGRQRKYKPTKLYWYKLKLQEEWQEFISRYEFDLFVTLTFREEIEQLKAKMRFEKWIGSLNNMLFDWRYKQRGRGIRYAVVYENQKRGILHMHALLGAEGLKELDREYMAELWKCNGYYSNLINLLFILQDKNTK